MASGSHQNDGADRRDSVESVQMRTVRLPEFDLERIGRVPDQFIGDVALRVELGRACLHSDEVTRLSEGSVVALDRQAPEPVDVYVAGALVARGELQIFEEKFCVRVTEVLFAGAKSRAA
jgi:flagellar motor switch protein FliN